MKTLLAFLFVTPAIFAQLPTKLEVLQKNRDNAISKINSIFEAEVRKLLNDPDVKADAVCLAKVQAELGIAPVTAKGGALAIKYQDFVAYDWFTRARSKFVFNEDKTGQFVQRGNTFNFTWKKKGDYVVATDLLGKQEWFFIFHKDRALLGLTMTQIADPIYPEHKSN